MAPEDRSLPTQGRGHLARDPDTALTMRAEAIIYQCIAHGVFLIALLNGEIAWSNYAEGSLDDRTRQALAHISQRLERDPMLKGRVLDRLRCLIGYEQTPGLILARDKLD